MGKDKSSRRVSKDQVRQNARDAGSSRSWFTLPEGVRQWAPEKSGSCVLDVVPYVVTIENHPDRIEKGKMWYKFPFQIHHNVGPNAESIICPASIGKPCPICKERQRLAKNWDENEEQIKSLNAQKYVAYNVIDPDDADKVAVFVMSRGKFAQALEKELDEGPDENLNFYDTNEDGRTLKVRFSDAEYGGHKYLEATRIDFTPRKAMDEEETLGKTVCLDVILDDKVMAFDKLKALFLQVEDSDAGESEETPRRTPSGTSAAGKPSTPEKDDDEDDDKPAPKGKPAAKDDDDDDDAPPAKSKAPAKDDDDDDDKPAAKGKLKVGDKVTAELNGKPIEGKITDIDDEDVTIECKDGKERIVDMADVALAGKAKAEVADKDDDDDEDDKPAPKGKAPAKDEDEDDDKAKFKVGDQVVEKDSGEAGEVIKVKGDDITVQMKSGKVVVDVDDLKPAGKAPDGFKPGDMVTWDDGDCKGTVVKVHSSGEKVKVKDADDEESWQPIEEVSKAKKK